MALLVSAVICAIYLFRIQTPEQEKAGLTRCLSLPVSLLGREPLRSIAGARICSLAPTRKMPHRNQSLHAFACQLHLDWHGPVTAKFILLCHKIVLLPPVVSRVQSRPLQALLEADSIHISKRP